MIPRMTVKPDKSSFEKSKRNIEKKGNDAKKDIIEQFGNIFISNLRTQLAMFDSGTGQNQPSTINTIRKQRTGDLMLIWGSEVIFHLNYGTRPHYPPFHRMLGYTKDEDKARYLQKYIGKYGTRAYDFLPGVKNKSFKEIKEIMKNIE